MAYGALSFTFFRVERFPELDDTLTVPSQILMFRDVTDTWVRRLPGLVLSSTYRMEAHHDVRVSVAGRTQGIFFTEYIRSHNFTVANPGPPGPPSSAPSPPGGTRMNPHPLQPDRDGY